jgi:hypothetical protein
MKAKRTILTVATLSAFLALGGLVQGPGYGRLHGQEGQTYQRQEGN